MYLIPIVCVKFQPFQYKYCIKKYSFEFPFVPELHTKKNAINKLKIKQKIYQSKRTNLNSTFNVCYSLDAFPFHFTYANISHVYICHQWFGCSRTAVQSRSSDVNKNKLIFLCLSIRLFQCTHWNIYLSYLVASFKWISMVKIDRKTKPIS